jgi:hypothetical protein
VLHRSNRWLVVHGGIGLAALAPLALRFSLPVAWSVVGAAGYAALVFALNPRALVVDDDGLASVPLLPFLPRRRVRWVDVLDLTWRTTRYGSYVVVKRTNGRRARRLTPLYSLERGGPAMSGAALCDLLRARWEAVTPAPELAERRARLAREAHRALHVWGIVLVLLALALTTLVMAVLAGGGAASPAGVVAIVALALSATGAASLAVLLLKASGPTSRRSVE